MITKPNCNAWVTDTFAVSTLSSHTKADNEWQLHLLFPIHNSKISFFSSNYIDNEPK
jgi:hypothetical protein